MFFMGQYCYLPISAFSEYRRFTDGSPKALVLAMIELGSEGKA
jgi:hypothetical protein